MSFKVVTVCLCVHSGITFWITNGKDIQDGACWIHSSRQMEDKAWKMKHLFLVVIVVKICIRVVA